MIAGRNVLGVITARGGSTGLRRKNILPFNGKPLIGWTIEAATKSKYIDRLILSSDDEEIISVAERFGCEVPFRRLPELATDEASSILVLCDALRRCPGFQYVVLLQPTSPLRSAEDIDAALESCTGLAAPACVSVCVASENPFWMFNAEEGRRLSPLISQDLPLRRQDAPKVLSLNGAVYVAEVEWFLREQKFIAPETVYYEMPPERSVDVDTELDLSLAELLAAKVTKN